MDDFLTAIQKRRSIYHIGDSQVVHQKKIQEVLEQAVLHSPSAFNMQSGRVMLLFGEHHYKLWNIVLETLQKIVAPDKFQPTREKINSFSAGYGTVLFFDDMDVVNRYADQFSTYRDKFPVFSAQGNAILQYNVWNLLEQEGLGASLQHYNPLIDQAVKEQWELPDSWELNAQMPFGSVVSGPGEKKFEPTESRIKIFS